MFNFEIKVKGRKAVPVEKKKGVSGSVNVDAVSFDFSSEEWDNTTKTAVFYIDKDTVYEQLLDSDNRAKIPWELLQTAGEIVKVGVYGVYGTGDDRVVITSTIVEIEIREGTIVGANADPGEYENIYVQVLARLEDMLDVLSYETSDVPEWELDEYTGQGIWYVSHISNKKIRVVAMGAAVIIKIERPNKEDVVLNFTNFEPKSFYSEEGFTVRYYKVTASTTEPTILLYDYITKMKLANIILDHDVTARELLDELWEYLSAVYMRKDRTVAGCPVQNNVTALQIWNELVMLSESRTIPGWDNYGLVKLASASEVGDWTLRQSNEVGTVRDIAYAISVGAWSDSQMSDESDNIVKNSVIKEYVDAVRNAKQNQIKQVVVNDGYWVDLETYPGIKYLDLVTTTLNDLWICYGINSSKAYVIKIASTTGTYIAENAYTKAEVNALIGALDKISKRKVLELPVTGEDNVIYLVPKTGEQDDVYDEWMWIDNQWEHFGNTQIDLSGYVPTSRMLGRIPLSSDVGAYYFASAIIKAIVEDSGSSMSSLINRLDDFFQLKENGKGLSTEDYTTEEKEKLEQYPTPSPSDEGKVLAIDSNGNPVWVTPSSGGDVSDVQINGTSILVSGVANIPTAGSSTYGVIKANNYYGVETDDNTGYLKLRMASDVEIKAASGSYRPISVSKQHASVFYGLAKAAGDTTQASAVNTNPVGTYTDTAKQKIREMLDVEGRTWEKLLEKTLSSANGTALDFSDVDFNGEYKAIKIKIMGTMASTGGNLYFYRMNSSSAYMIFANAGKTESTEYEFIVQNDPTYHSDGTLLGVSVELKGTAMATNLQNVVGKVAINQQSVNEIYELKISSTINFGSGTKIGVWGLK